MLPAPKNASTATFKVFQQLHLLPYLTGTNKPSGTANRLARLDGVGVGASRAGAGGHGLGLVARRGTLELLADFLHAGRAGGAIDGGGVTEVGVDASEELAVGGCDALDHDVAFGALLAVAAGAVELAEGVDCEAVDRDGSGAVVLDDFVLGASCAAAGDGSVAIALEGKSVCRMSISQHEKWSEKAYPRRRQPTIRW